MEIKHVMTVYFKDAESMEEKIMEKSRYEKPQGEVIIFDVEDIITTSGMGGDDGGDNDGKWSGDY